jgi:hypothetical protein
MVRRGWSFPVVVVAVVALASCSDDGGDGGDAGGEAPPTTGETAPATLPDDVEAGTAVLVLDGVGYPLEVRACALAPTTDPATGVTTDLAIDAEDSLGVAVSISRTTTQGDVPTVNDTVSVVQPDGTVLEANRAEVNGRFVDLLAEGALTPLLTVDGDVVSGSGVFGPPGARPGDEGLVEGSLIVRCPPGG